MTERKIVLYLEQKTISEKYQRAFMRSMTANTSPRVVDYYLFNSLNAELNSIFEKFNIDKKILLDLKRRSIYEISLIRWNVVKKHLCKLVPVEKLDMVFLLETIESFKKKKVPVIIMIEEEGLLEDTVKKNLDIIKKINAHFIKDNILLAINRELNLDPLRYRIYLENRLLVERYYPIDIESNRIVAETIYFKENTKGNLRIESNFDLQIKRVEIDGQKHDTYSSSFLLP